MVRTAGCGNSLEVGVVVQHDETGRLRGGRDDQIRDRQAVLTTASELVLQLNGPFHDIRGDGRGVQLLPTLIDDLLVVVQLPPPKSTLRSTIAHVAMRPSSMSGRSRPDTSATR